MPPAPPATFAEALGRQLRVDGARPLVTCYDDATGERVELSVATYANWVAKTANLLTHELEVEHGDLLHVDLPTHWLGTVWLGAAWSIGLAVTDDESVREARLIVCGPDHVQRYADAAGRLVALSLRPFGLPFAEPLPDGVLDYGAVVLGQPDVLVAFDPPAADDPAWLDAAGTVTQADLLAVDAAPDRRVLTDVNPCSRRGGKLLVASLLGAGAVWVRNPDPLMWERRSDSERCTDTVRG